MSISVCQYCGKGFAVKPSRKILGKGLYCSRPCYLKAKRRRTLVKCCGYCGKIFHTKRGEARYCSRSCAGKAAMHRGGGEMYYCRTCNTPFIPSYTLQVFCSRACEIEEGARHMPMFDDPWISGAIPPDHYGRDYYRSPDVYLGF